MKNKKTTTEEFWQEEPTYQTGSTIPPKSYGGIIAFLLVLVIFLCGISTALGLLNIRLFQKLSDLEHSQENCAVAFSESSLGSKAIDEDLVRFSPGFSGQGVPDFWQHYHQLPQGIYVTDVEPGSPAENSGLLPEDVLTHLEGIPVPNAETLESLLQTYATGQLVNMGVYREGMTLTLSITME